MVLLLLNSTAHIPQHRQLVTDERGGRGFHGHSYVSMRQFMPNGAENMRGWRVIAEGHRRYLFTQWEMRAAGSVLGHKGMLDRCIYKSLYSIYARERSVGCLNHRQGISSPGEEEQEEAEDNALADSRQDKKQTKKERIKRIKEKSHQRVVNAAAAGVMYPPEEERRIRNSWARLMRWSRNLRQREAARASGVCLEKVVVFGGGSFGTAMGVALARQHPQLNVVLLLRDPYLCKDINEKHCNTRYLPNFNLPDRVTATTSAEMALKGAQYAIHAVPVQHSRDFLTSIKEYIDPALPIISVSKGIEVTTGKVMSDLIPSALGRKQPTVFLSGPSFAQEVIAEQPTGLVAASRDKNLCREVQNLFASPTMRINITTDVIGVEICGALKNVLAIAAGIVEGLELGNNAMAALISQGCSEIRWLAEKMGAKPATVSGLSGLGDIMLTCYGSLSRNRTVGVRLGKGEALSDIISSSSQVAEGVPTAGAVVSLARKYRVQLPVLTAVAQVLNGHLSAAEAVAEIMNLPQIEER